MIRYLTILIGVFTASVACAQSIVVSDTRDAYEKAVAIKAVYAEVNARIQTIRKDFETQSVPLSAELEKLRGQNDPQSKQRKTQLLLQLSELEKQAAAKQQQVGASNEKALAKIDAQISSIEQAIKTERKAHAVLRAQDVLYVRADCPCLITEELYRRLNQQLPKVSLDAN